MSLKKIKVIGVLVIFLFTVLFHFIYDLLPNVIFSFFFPVNESIWEHMKLLYSGIIGWSIIEYFILKKNNLNTKNHIYQTFLTAFSSIIVYLIIYLPLYSFFGENIYISIGLLILVIILEEIFSYYLIKDDSDKELFNKISLILIILFYSVFIAFTYEPPKNYLFYDISNHGYGLNLKK